MAIWVTRSIRAKSLRMDHRLHPAAQGEPFEPPAVPLEGQVFALNPDLTEWAFNLTRAIPLADSDKLQQIRAQFDGAAAQRPPFVTLGDEISSSTYWHGKTSRRLGYPWVANLPTQGQLVTTAMEDTGTLLALKDVAAAASTGSASSSCARSATTTSSPAA